jgi:CDP-paratose 2-epimerase
MRSWRFFNWIKDDRSLFSSASVYLSRYVNRLYFSSKENTMRVIVTGGAGFIGTNTVSALISRGDEVIVLDDLSRPGSDQNLAWLQDGHEGLIHEQIDIRDFPALRNCFAKHAPLDLVLHFAGQVAVTTSVHDPRGDFEINALGTLNVLESLRFLELDPVVLYSSTNKVYGGLPDFNVCETDNRYTLVDSPMGVSERTQLDFYSPYGCSKGAADQYVRDYHRIYGLRTIVFRNSCIYGPRQFGIEDQGWVAWFIIAATLGRKISIYGNGKQVRDVLFVDDLIDAMFMAIDKIEITQGQIYNMGGGPNNSLAIWTEFGLILEELFGKSISVAYKDWRPGDQPVYISDIRKANQDFDWNPTISVQDGIARLYEWVQENVSLFR